MARTLELDDLVRIVPTKADDGAPTNSMGTKVFVGDKEIRYVTKIIMIAEVDDVWRAEIHVLPEGIEMNGLVGKVVEVQPEITPDSSTEGIYDATALDSQTRLYRGA